MRTTIRMLTSGGLGLIYGAVLAFWGLMSAGAGHGTYVALGLVSSPLCVLGIWAALFGPPLYWATVGLAIGRLQQYSARRLLVMLLLMHYVPIVPILSIGPYSDWERLPRVFSVSANLFPFTCGCVFYLAGQCYCWIMYMRARTKYHISDEDRNLSTLFRD